MMKTKHKQMQHTPNKTTLNHSKRRRFIKYFLFAGVILSLSFFMWTQTRSAKHFVKSYAQSLINSSIKGKINARTLDGNLYTGLSLGDVTVHDAHGAFVAHVPQMHIKYTPWALLGQTITLDSITIKHAIAFVQRHKDGGFNLEHILKPQEQDKAQNDSFPIVINTMHIHASSFIWLDEAMASATQAQKLRALVRDSTHTADAITLERFVAKHSAPVQVPGMASMRIDDLYASFAMRIDGSIMAKAPYMRGQLVADTIPHPLQLHSTDLGLELTQDVLTLRHASFHINRSSGWTQLNAQLKLKSSTFFASVHTLGLSQELLNLCVPNSIFLSGVDFTGSVQSQSSSTLLANLQARPRQGRSMMDVVAHISLPETAYNTPKFDANIRLNQLNINDFVDLNKDVSIDTYIEELSADMYGHGNALHNLVAQVYTSAHGTIANRHEIDFISAHTTYKNASMTLKDLTLATPYAHAWAQGAASMNGAFELHLFSFADKTHQPLTKAKPGTHNKMLLEAHLKGHADVLKLTSHNKPMGALKKLHFKTQWDIAQFRLPGILALDSSKGKATLDFEHLPSSKANAQLKYTLELDLDNLKTNLGVHVQHLFAGANGQASSHHSGSLDLTRLLKSVRTQATLRAKNAKIRTLHIDSADLSLNTQTPTPGHDDLAVNVRGIIEHVRLDNSQPIKSKHAQLNLTLGAKLATTLGTKSTPISSWSINGLIKNKDFALLHGVNIKHLDLYLTKMRGDFTSLPQGNAELRIKGFKVGDERISQLRTSLHMEKDGSVDLDLFLMRDNVKHKKVRLIAGAHISKNLDNMLLKNGTLSFEGGMRWAVQGAQILRTKDSVTIKNMDLRQGAQSISGGGIYRPRGHEELHLHLNSLDLAKLRSGASLERYLPQITGIVDFLKLDITGTYKAPKLHATLKADDMYYEHSGPFDVHIDARYEHNKLTLNRFMLEGWGKELLFLQSRIPMKLDLGGHFKIFWTQPLLLTFRMPTLDLSTLAKHIPALKTWNLRGTVLAGALISGTLRAPTMDLLAKGSNLGMTTRIKGQRVSFQNVDFTSKIDYEPPQHGTKGLVATTTLRHKKSSATQPLLDFSISTPLPLATWLYESMEQGKHMDLARGTWRQPFDLKLHIHHLDLGSLNITPLFEDTSASGVINASLIGSGTFDDPRIALNFHVGRLEGNKGHDQKTFDGFGWNRYRNVVVQSKARIERQTLILDKLLINWDLDDILTAHGSMPLPIKYLMGKGILKDLKLDFNAKVSPTPLRKFMAVNYNIFAGAKGTLGGHFDLTGSLKKPQLRAHVSLKDTELKKGRLGSLKLAIESDNDTVRLGAYLIDGKQSEPKTQRKLLAASAAMRVNLDILEILGGSNWSHIHPSSRQLVAMLGGEEKLRPEEDLRLHLKTYKGKPIDLNEALPEWLLGRHLDRTQGLLRLDANMKGTWSNLKTQGVLELTQGAMTIKRFGRHFHDIYLNWRLHSNALLIDHFALFEGDTSIGLKGSLTHQRLIPKTLDLVFISDKFDAGSFIDLPFFVTSEAKIDVDLTQKPYATAVHAKKLEVRLPYLSNDLHDTELLDDIIMVDHPHTKHLWQQLATAHVDEEEFHEVNSIASLLHTTVKVHLAKGSTIFHPYGKLRFFGDLVARLGQGTVRVTGKVEAQDGDVEFLGKSFLVDKGVVTFTGATPINPKLQAEAVYPLKRSVAETLGPSHEGKPRIIIRVTGAARDPQVRLRSDPDMSDSDILYVLATGRPPSTADVGQNAGVADAAMNAASGMLLGMVKKQLGEFALIDTFRSDTSGVELGKYITENIFISYRLRFGSDGDDAESIFEVEYRFLPTWLMTAKFSDKAQSEFNMFWDLY